MENVSGPAAGGAVSVGEEDRYGGYVGGERTLGCAHTSLSGTMTIDGS